MLRARLRLNGTPVNIVALSGDLQTNVWQHVALTYDGGVARLYLDGVEVGSRALSGTIDFDSTATLAVAKQPGATQFFDGLIDDVRILQRASSVADIQLLVSGNDIPVAAGESYTVSEDTTLTVDTADGVLANDSDPDGELLTAVLEDNPLNGVVSLSLDGSFSYVPNADFAGTDSFTYRASDGTGASVVTVVSISVIGENDAPVAQNDEFQVLPGQLLVVGAPGLLGNDSDADSDTLSLASTSITASNGVLTVEVDGSFTYLPNNEFSGIDTFTYQAQDSSGASSFAASVFINVVEPPVANDDTFSVAEDAILNVVASGVLENDTDVNSPLDLAVELLDPPANGTLTLAVDGGFEYRPEDNFNGLDSFTYRAVSYTHLTLPTKA